MDFKKLAQEILDLVGGVSNIKKVNKDYTNLRFVLKDVKKANKAAIEKLEGVKSVQATDTHLNVMIGAKVSEAYKELINITGEFKEEEEVITKGVVLKAKLAALVRASVIPMIVCALLYAITYFLKGVLDASIYKWVSLLDMGINCVFAAYVTNKCGEIFKAKTVVASAIAGFVVGVNAYIASIYVVLASIVVVIVGYSLAFIITYKR